MPVARPAQEQEQEPGAVERPVLFLLHALGGSARAWDAVVARLEPAFACVALDLPGFGDAAADGRTDVEGMVDWLADAIRARDPAAYMLAGHSMSGKVVTLLAMRAQEGEAGLSGLTGVVLLAASPPAPEPMAEDRREEMIGWFARGQPTREQAAGFVDANTASRLPDAPRERAIADVLRCGRHAWLAWLERGSREDWSDRVPRLAVPAVILAGAKDGDLGEKAQARLNAPIYADARIEVIADAAHLLPMEQPERVAAAIAAHGQAVCGRALPPAWARLLASDRVSRRTRAAMLARIAPPPPDAPTCLDMRQRAVLAAAVARVLPGCGDPAVLARRLDRALAERAGDGWRFADLPADAQAWAAGLDTLDALGFAALPAERQDTTLRSIAGGSITLAAAPLDGARLRLWFADLRAEAVRMWLAHPAAMARIGYDGFANGGDGARPQGYARTGADDAEPWQPAAARRRGPP